MFEFIRRRLRGWPTRLSLLFKGGRVALSTALLMERGAVFRADRGAVVRSYGSLLLQKNATLEIGARTAIMQGCEITVGSRGHLSIGPQVYIGAYCNIRCSGAITIGEQVRLGQFVSIIDANYSFNRRDVPIAETVPERVTIGAGAWLGAQVVVLPGVDVGEGAVVGAGSVVTKTVPAFAIVGGNPASIIGYRR